MAVPSQLRWQEAILQSSKRVSPLSPQLSWHHCAYGRGKKGAIGLKHGSVQAEIAWLNKCNLYFRTGNENTNPPLLKFAQLPLITHMVGERGYAPSAQNTCFLMTFSVWPASKHAGLFLIRLVMSYGLYNNWHSSQPTCCLAWTSRKQSLRSPKHLEEVLVPGGGVWPAVGPPENGWILGIF